MHPLEEAHGDLARLGLGHFAHQPGRQHEVFDRRQMRKQVELLEHHADLAAHGVDIFERIGQLDTVHRDAPAVVGLEPVDAADHRRLAGARRTADNHLLALADFQIDIFQGLEFAEEFIDVLKADNRVLSGLRHGFPHRFMYRPNRHSARAMPLWMNHTITR